tara:strand:+ start:1587 stop:1814 length:228 start_codon:yes stop_codon:yes gene_type:complete
MTKTQQNKIMKAIRSSKGRFFGLYTKAGEALNAQFVSESSQYVTVYDRNAKDRRKFAKTSLSGLKLSDVKIGAVS